MTDANTPISEQKKAMEKAKETLKNHTQVGTCRVLVSPSGSMMTVLEPMKDCVNLANLMAIISVISRGMEKATEQVLEQLGFNPAEIEKLREGNDDALMEEAYTRASKVACIPVDALQDKHDPITEAVEEQGTKTAFGSVGYKAAGEGGTGTPENLN